MQLFTKFNRKNIQDRQIDTLLGLCKGISADQCINQAEAEFLHGWLVQNAYTDNPIILNLLEKVSVMLEDEILDQDESLELLSILTLITGEQSDFGEIAKTSNLPICSPPPAIKFTEKVFVFTGTFAFGSRSQCKEIIETLGGINTGNITKKVDYLVLGAYVSDSWIHESYGRKIEKAIHYRDSGTPIAIISEEHWLREASL